MTFSDRQHKNSTSTNHVTVIESKRLIALKNTLVTEEIKIDCTLHNEVPLVTGVEYT
jgi:hypothetical protein